MLKFVAVSLARGHGHETPLTSLTADLCQDRSAVRPVMSHAVNAKAKTESSNLTLHRSRPNIATLHETLPDLPRNYTIPQGWSYYEELSRRHDSLS